MHSALTSIVTKMSEMQQTIDVLNKKVDAANRRSAAYEAFFKTIVGNTNILIDIARNLKQKRQQETPRVSEETDERLPVIEIPEEYEMEDSELRRIMRDSRNAGNFAVNISRRLWPELFGEGDLRFQYNWYGGRIHNKKELDPVRKSVVKKYVCVFYPEVASEDTWRERIVSRINESLRRNDKQTEKTVLPPQVQAWTLSSQRLTCMLGRRVRIHGLTRDCCVLVHTLVFRSSVLFLFDCEPVTIFKFESYYYYMFEVLFVALMFNK